MARATTSAGDSAAMIFRHEAIHLNVAEICTCRAASPTAKIAGFLQPSAVDETE